MTTACKCDRCKTLFEHAPGTVSVEYHITTKVDKEGSPTQEGWSSDLCPKCSGEFLVAIKHEEQEKRDAPSG